MGLVSAGRQGDNAQHVPRDRCLERQNRCFGSKGGAYVIQGRDSDLRAFHSLHVFCSPQTSDVKPCRLSSFAHFLCKMYVFAYLFPFKTERVFSERSKFEVRRTTSAVWWAPPPKLRRSWRKSHQGEGLKGLKGLKDGTRRWSSAGW